MTRINNSGAGGKIISPALFSAAVLAGGESRRMGCNKALMDYHGRPLIMHVLETVEQVIPKLAIVAKIPQEYQSLGREVLQDAHKLQTPLVGILTALLGSQTDYVFITSCDMPFLTAEVVRIICEQSMGSDITVPRWDEHYEPLCAVYNRSCIPNIRKTLETGEHKVIAFWDQVRVKQLDEKFWKDRSISPKTFINVNRPEDWPK